MTMTYIQITLAERRSIEQMLKRHLSVSAMAKELRRDPQTISRELKRNRSRQKEYLRHKMSRIPNDCLHRKTCMVEGICGNNCHLPGVSCKLCDRCNYICEAFENNPCPRNRDKAPWVCNSCPVTSSCTRKKYYYRASDAHKLSEERKAEARSGITLTENEVDQLNKIFSPRLKKGQSIHSIYKDRIDYMPCCEKSIYNLVDQGLFEATNLDLRLKVRRRPRKEPKRFKVDKKCYLGRTYKDFKLYLDEHPSLTEVQMDTVLGPSGRSEKVLLTLYWKQANFLLIFLLKQRRSAYVIERFDQLRVCLGIRKFKLLFPLLLTDRGSEFTNPAKIEGGSTKVFYCDPQQPQQKGALEQEHSLIRQIIPKGMSFDHLQQEDIAKMNSHITSYARPGLGDKTPQEVFSFLFGQDLLQCFGLERVKPEDVILNNTLLQGFTGPTLGSNTKNFPK